MLKCLQRVSISGKRPNILMKNLTQLTLICLIFTIIPGVYGESAQDDVSDWKHNVLFYGWAVSIHGDLEVGTIDTEVNIEFKDILDKFSGGAAVIYEGWNDNWWTYFDGSVTLLEDDPTLNGLELEIDSTFVVVEGGIGHRITDRSFPVAFGGFRWIGIDTDIDSAIGTKEGDFEGFVDPIFGLYHRHWLSERWMLRVLGDIGGFGVGSELSWGLGVGFVRKFDGPFSFQCGYRILNIDYDEDIEFDGSLQGAYIGIGLRL